MKYFSNKPKRASSLTLQSSFNRGGSSLPPIDQYVLSDYLKSNNPHLSNEDEFEDDETRTNTLRNSMTTSNRRSILKNKTPSISNLQNHSNSNANAAAAAALSRSNSLRNTSLTQNQRTGSLGSSTPRYNSGQQHIQHQRRVAPVATVNHTKNKRGPRTYSLSRIDEQSLTRGNSHKHKANNRNHIVGSRNRAIPTLQENEALIAANDNDDIAHLIPAFNDNSITNDYTHLASFNNRVSSSRTNSLLSNSNASADGRAFSFSSLPPPPSVQRSASLTNSILSNNSLDMSDMTIQSTTTKRGNVLVKQTKIVDSQGTTRKIITKTVKKVGNYEVVNSNVINLSSSNDGDNLNNRIDELEELDQLDNHQYEDMLLNDPHRNSIQSNTQDFDRHFEGFDQTMDPEFSAGNSSREQFAPYSPPAFQRSSPNFRHDRLSSLEGDVNNDDFTNRKLVDDQQQPQQPHQPHQPQTTNTGFSHPYSNFVNNSPKKFAAPFSPSEVDSPKSSSMFSDTKNKIVESDDTIVSNFSRENNLTTANYNRSLTNEQAGTSFGGKKDNIAEISNEDEDVESKYSDAVSNPAVSEKFKSASSEGFKTPLLSSVEKVSHIAAQIHPQHQKSAVKVSGESSSSLSSAEGFKTPLLPSVEQVREQISSHATVDNENVTGTHPYKNNSTSLEGFKTPSLPSNGKVYHSPTTNATTRTVPALAPALAPTVASLPPAVNSVPSSPIKEFGLKPSLLNRHVNDGNFDLVSARSGKSAKSRVSFIGVEYINDDDQKSRHAENTMPATTAPRKKLTEKEMYEAALKAAHAKVYGTSNQGNSGRQTRGHHLNHNDSDLSKTIARSSFERERRNKVPNGRVDGIDSTRNTHSLRSSTYGTAAADSPSSPPRLAKKASISESLRTMSLTSFGSKGTFNKLKQANGANIEPKNADAAVMNDYGKKGAIISPAATDSNNDRYSGFKTHSLKNQRQEEVQEKKKKLSRKEKKYLKEEEKLKNMNLRDEIKAIQEKSQKQKQKQKQKQQQQQQQKQQRGSGIFNGNISGNNKGKSQGLPLRTSEPASKLDNDIGGTAGEQLEVNDGESKLHNIAEEADGSGKRNEAANGVPLASNGNSNLAGLSAPETQGPADDVLPKQKKKFSFFKLFKLSN